MTTLTRLLLGLHSLPRPLSESFGSLRYEHKEEEKIQKIIFLSSQAEVINPLKLTLKYYESMFHDSDLDAELNDLHERFVVVPGI